MPLFTRVVAWMLVLFLAGCSAQGPDRTVAPSGDTGAQDTADAHGDTDTGEQDAALPDTLVDMTIPDNAAVVAESQDYFLSAWNRRYDGTVRFDLNAYHGITDFAAVDGYIHGAFTDAGDANFFVLFPGMQGNINWGQGKDRPIDVSVYSRAVYRLCLHSATDTVKSHFYWYKQTTFDGVAGWSDRNPLQPGCHIYAHDWSGADPWRFAESGRVYGIRFDFDGYAVGDTFDLDWFRLVPPPSGQQVVEAAWSDVPADNTELTLYIDGDAQGFDGDPVAAVPVSSPSGSFGWGSQETRDQSRLVPDDLPAGVYHLYWEGNAGYRRYLDRPVVVDQVPVVTITHPSRTSGQDYSEEAGARWDLQEADDVELRNVDTASLDGGVLTAQSTANDPGIRFHAPVAIDGSYYRFFQIDVWSQFSFFNNPGFSGDVGGMMRVLWGNAEQRGTTEDIIIRSPDQWHTYAIDLATCFLEGGGGADWTPVPSNWSGQQWTWLRFDPNENTRAVPWQWKIRNVRLTGPPVSEGTIDVRWELHNEAGEPVDLHLYYAASPDDPPTPIDSVTSMAGPGAYTWDTRALPPGEYTVIACAEDSYHTRCASSDAPVLVRPPAP